MFKKSQIKTNIKCDELPKEVLEIDMEAIKKAKEKFNEKKYEKRR